MFHVPMSSPQITRIFGFPPAWAAAAGCPTSPVAATVSNSVSGVPSFERLAPPSRKTPWGAAVPGVGCPQPPPRPRGAAAGSTLTNPRPETNEHHGVHRRFLHVGVAPAE